mgnify:CR=1 FL=1
MIFFPPNLRTQKLQKYRFLGSQTKSDPLFFYGGNSMHAVCTILSFFMNHEINLLWAVLLKVDNRVGTLRGLTGDKVPDSLVARAKYNKDIICYEINTNLEECSSDDDVNDWWIRVNGPERGYIGRTFVDIAVERKTSSSAAKLSRWRNMTPSMASNSSIKTIRDGQRNHFLNTALSAQPLMNQNSSSKHTLHATFL